MNQCQAAAFLQIKEITGIDPGAKVLDAPCGKGELTQALLEVGMDVLGVDIEVSETDAAGTAFGHADLNAEIPARSGAFDLVVSVEGIEHLENPHLFLREANRVLKRSGRLVLTTPNVISLRSRVRFMGSGFFHRDSVPLNEASRHPLHLIGLRTFPQLRYDLHTLGFHLESVGSTHIKTVSYVYGIFVPWMFLYTLVAFRKEKDAEQRKRNREIFRSLYSRPLLFGENLVLVARKVDGLSEANQA
ncbi:MAG TPA: class I SAM-dependent methyltransferase [Aridibacter sp.]|nr:class I SAM-dependent methyltransferase [Aridibacter sp.]